MDAKEHAEIWTRAAKIVAAMDPRDSWSSQQTIQAAYTTQVIGRAYTQQEAAAWDAFSVAARVLRSIAREYETAAKEKA